MISTLAIFSAGYGSQPTIAKPPGNGMNEMAYLVSLGLRVVRFENREVMENLEGVLVEIRHQAHGWQEKP
jgi:hypothetical protein